MSLKLAARFVGVIPYKIADLTAADQNPYIEDLSSVLPPGTVAILVRGNRVTGTDNLSAYPMSNTTQSINIGNQTQKNASLVPIRDRELRWKLGADNDDWDLYLFGYFVQKVTR